MAHERITFPDGVLDEIVLNNASVHLEQLSTESYMLILEKDDVHIHLVVHNPLVYEYLIGGELQPEGTEWQP